MKKDFYKTKCISVKMTETQAKELEKMAERETVRRQQLVSIGEIIREKVFDLRFPPSEDEN